MSTHLTVHDIEDVDFQRREWKVERTWWPLLGLLVVVGLLGLFSGGPLSETSAGGPSAGVEVKYERFVRNTGKATWTIQLMPAAVQNRKVSLFVSAELIEAMRVENMAPTPTTETSTPEGVLLQWDAVAGSAPRVSLRFRPDGLGLKDGYVRAVDGTQVPMSLLLYP